MELHKDIFDHFNIQSAAISARISYCMTWNDAQPSSTRAQDIWERNN